MTGTTIPPTRSNRWTPPLDALALATLEGAASRLGLGRRRAYEATLVPNHPGHHCCAGLAPRTPLSPPTVPPAGAGDVGL